MYTLYNPLKYRKHSQEFQNVHLLFQTESALGKVRKQVSKVDYLIANIQVKEYTSEGADLELTSTRAVKTHFRTFEEQTKL